MNYEIRNSQRGLWTLGYMDGAEWIALEDFTDYVEAQLALIEAQTH